MMRRRRKVSVVDEEKENEDRSSRMTMQLTQNGSCVSNNSTVHQGPMYTIMSNVQLNETFHKKYIKEMQQLYSKMDNDAFMFAFIKMIKSAMEGDENNDFANTTLLFCAKYIGSYDVEDTHPVLSNIFKWLLTTISHNPHIRFRLCQFVNMILNALGAEAALDDIICDQIMEYMLARLRDISPSVRVQAILALQRLQVPDNPDDPVLRSYQFHLCSDPSPRVRQAVITSMGRNYNTIPYILDRLWDIDEKVRRHTYLHMSSYPVKSYKVSQRLMLMEQGLNDRSEMVRKVVVNIMLQQWIESYQKNLILLVQGLKLDSNGAEIDRFRKITKLTLKEVFKRLSKDELIACIPFEKDGEFHKCVPHEKLTIEISLYWQCLTEYLQEQSADELELVVPELSTFCAYVEKLCQSQKDDMDKFQQMEFQYILLALMEILYTFDLGDEIGRDNLKKLISTMLRYYQLEDSVIAVVTKCAENLIENQNARLQYLVEIIQEVCNLNTKQYDLLHDRNLINDLMEKSSDADLNLKLSSLKVKILDLEEQEINLIQQKDYVKANKITEEKNACMDEYSNLLKPLLEQHSSPDSAALPFHQTKKLCTETILKCLQVAFHMVVSEKVHSLTPNVCKLYNDFIRRHISSNQIAVRDWALKCGIAYSMLYESLAKDVFYELYSQFFKNHNIRIWKTAISGIFEMLDRYGMDHFATQEPPAKSKRTGRQLYNTMEFLDIEEEAGSSSIGQGVDVIFMMSHFLDTCDDVCITSEIVKGLCRLILRGHMKNGEIVEKLLLRYFNPASDDVINQILGAFLENLIQRKKQDLIYPCLLPTITSVLTAPYDSPLQEIKPQKIMRFIIDATRQEFCVNDSNIHRKLAESFLQEMLSSVDNKDLCKLLAKEIITLEINVADNQSLKKDMMVSVEKLIKCDFDPKTKKNLIDFKDMLDGKFNPSLQNTEPQASDEEDKSDFEIVASAEGRKSNSSATTAHILETCTSELSASAEKETEVANNVDRTLSPSHALRVISPSASAPTTYGRENIVGHRYLRKSLNTSRSNSMSELSDGPSRPPKIRIEARIDSDKKKDKSKEQRIVPQNSRVRRNLALCVGRADRSPTSTQSSDDGVTAMGVNEDTEMYRTAAVIQLESSDISKETSPQHNSQGRKEKEKTDTVEERGGQRAEATPIRRTRRAAAAAAGRWQTAVVNKDKRINKTVSTKRQETDTEECKSPDVIVASPMTDVPHRRATRLRKMGSGRLALQPSAQSKSSIAQTESTNTLKEFSNDASGSNSQVMAITPIRNGRKRIFRSSSTASLNSAISMKSPVHKQSKIENSCKASSTRAQKQLRKPAEGRPAIDSKTSETGSPSSAKENELCITNSQSGILAVATLPSSNQDERNEGDIGDGHQSDAVSRSRRSGKLSSSTVASIPTRLARRRLAEMALDHSSRISTRKVARKEYQNSVIMTRKRFSLENQVSNSLQTTTLIRTRSAISVASSPVKRTIRLSASSKIPVRSVRSKTSSASLSSETIPMSSTGLVPLPSRVKNNKSHTVSSRLPMAKAKTTRLPSPTESTQTRRVLASSDGLAGNRAPRRR